MEKPGEKINQFDVLNDVYVSYAMGGAYLTFSSGPEDDYEKTSPGCFVLGYERTLSRVITMGFMGAYNPVKETPKPMSGSTTVTEHNYLQGLAKIGFHYLRKPAFSMYSGVGFGVTMDMRKETDLDLVSKSRELLPAWQLVFLGFRIGRSAAGIIEFGIGSVSILNLGFSYKFGK